MTAFNFKKYSPSIESDQNVSLWNRILSNKFYRISLGTIAGAIIGLLYWEFIGCTGGNCALTSNPYKTVIMFSIMGGFFAREKKGDSGCC